MAAGGDDIFDPNMVEDNDLRIQAQHKFGNVFSVYEALGVEVFTEELHYKSWCSAIYLTWDIEIRLEKEIPFNNFHMFVGVKRNDVCDQGAVEVGGHLVIWLVNAEGRKCPVTYQLEFQSDGSREFGKVFAIDEHYRCLLRDDDYLTFPDDVLVVNVEFYQMCSCGMKALAYSKL